MIIRKLYGHYSDTLKNIYILNEILINLLSHLAWLTGLPCPSRANKDYTIAV